MHYNLLWDLKCIKNEHLMCAFRTAKFNTPSLQGVSAKQSLCYTKPIESDELG